MAEITPLRSPICCFIGSSYSGKTRLLDCIRETSVQQRETVGYTVASGASYIGYDIIREKTKEIKTDAKISIPGLVFVDTPGLEPFNNTRSLCSRLCDIAVLVVDIFSGLKPQTLESLNLLKTQNKYFIVALNKVDKLFGWKTCCNIPFRESLKLQSKAVQNDFKHRVTEIIAKFKEQGVNTELYFKNKNVGDTYRLVPTSTIGGEGVGELLLLLVQSTQKSMVDQLTYNNDVLKCTVLESEYVEGVGNTIDVVLTNGVLRKGDMIRVTSYKGSERTTIKTKIRALYTPHPMEELRVKGSFGLRNYISHDEVRAGQVIKISGKNLEQVVLGTDVYVEGGFDDSEVEDIEETAVEAMGIYVMSSDGIFVHAPTRGLLEALLLKLKQEDIPVSGARLGPVDFTCITKARSQKRVTFLTFDVEVTPEAREIVNQSCDRIFPCDNFDFLSGTFKDFMKYLDELEKEGADLKVVGRRDHSGNYKITDAGGDGVYVHAPSLGRLVALRDTLKEKVRVNGIEIGPVDQEHVIKVRSIHDRKSRNPTIVAFDVEVTTLAFEVAAHLDVRILVYDNIQRVSASYKSVVNDLDEQDKEGADTKESVVKDVGNYKMTGSEGVYVHVPTLLTMVSLRDNLEKNDILVCGMHIGPVNTEYVITARVMFDMSQNYATIIAYDVKVTPEARELANHLGVRIFISDNIRHLSGSFKAFMNDVDEQEKEGDVDDCFYERAPCVLEITSHPVICKNSINMDVHILQGHLYIGAQVLTSNGNPDNYGCISFIACDNKRYPYAHEGQVMSIQIIRGSNRMAGTDSTVGHKLYAIRSKKLINDQEAWAPYHEMIDEKALCP